MIPRLLPTLLGTLAAMLIGVAGGLLYGLIVQPVKFVDVDPIDLAQDQKQDYVRLIAAAYVQDGDLEAASERLGHLGYGGPEVGRLAYQAISNGDPSARALARLSTDLGAGQPAFALVLATPTFSPTPSPTITLTPSPTIADTPWPTATAEPPSPSPTTAPSLPPTTTPRPVPSPTLIPPVVPTTPYGPTVPPAPTAEAQPVLDFRIVERSMNPKMLNGGPEGCGLNILFLTVLDAAGHPLDGVTIDISWPGGSEHVVSGYKAPGKVEFTMRGGYTVQIVGVAPDGRPLASQSTYVDNEFPPSEDMLAAGYCATIAECDQMKATGQWCRWHHSYYVTFQRSW
ncbi:MAG: hypothetical protein M5U01_31950 [Ardenticatenaceae bacterium]|nr:hypothetical protein [Ardenticatenaceae bacterium]